MRLFVIHDSKVNKCGFWLLPGQNKTFEDVSLGCWKITTGLFHYFLLFYEQQKSADYLTALVKICKNKQTYEPLRE